VLDGELVFHGSAVLDTGAGFLPSLEGDGILDVPGDGILVTSVGGAGSVVDIDGAFLAGNLGAGVYVGPGTGTIANSVARDNAFGLVYYPDGNLDLDSGNLFEPNSSGDRVELEEGAWGTRAFEPSSGRTSIPEPSGGSPAHPRRRSPGCSPGG
jgi:hypothetical protein